MHICNANGEEVFIFQPARDYRTANRHSDLSTCDAISKFRPVSIADIRFAGCINEAFNQSFGRNAFTGNLLVAEKHGIYLHGPHSGRQELIPGTYFPNGQPRLNNIPDDGYKTRRVLCQCKWNDASALMICTCINVYMYSKLWIERRTALPRLSVPRLSEAPIIRTEFQTWSLFKKVVFLIKIAVSATEQSTMSCVCVSYVHVQCGHTVVRHRVQCEV